MLRTLLYDIDCDTCHGTFGTGVNPFRLQSDAEAAGWKLRRRKDGKIARSGGKDYCPPCAKVAGFTVTKAQPQGQATVTIAADGGESRD